MDPEELQQKRAEFRKGIKAFKNLSRIDECFHHNKSECQGAIKQAHSIQRNGRLSIIEGNVNGNKMIYSSTSYDVDENYPIKTLIPIGKKEASTFFGFCDYHDSKLFSPIENFPFDSSDKHCFLHSYRSFAHTYHRKKEEHKMLTTPSKHLEIYTPNDLYYKIKGVELGLADLEFYKQKLDQMLDNEEYDGLEYYVYTLPRSYPIAFSGAFTPYFTPNGIVVNDINEAENPEPFKNIMLTVLPDKEQTIIIFACFPEDQKCVLYLDELELLGNKKEERLKRVVSSIIISAGENFFFAPAVWNILGLKGQRLLCDELIKIIRDIPLGFFNSKICFFDPRFSAKNLVLS